VTWCNEAGEEATTDAIVVEVRRVGCNRTWRFSVRPEQLGWRAHAEMLSAPPDRGES
jgi:hypothetical protein